MLLASKTDADGPSDTFLNRHLKLCVAYATPFTPKNAPFMAQLERVMWARSLINRSTVTLYQIRESEALVVARRCRAVRIALDGDEYECTSICGSKSAERTFYQVRIKFKWSGGVLTPVSQKCSCCESVWTINCAYLLVRTHAVDDSMRECDDSASLVGT